MNPQILILKSNKDDFEKYYIEHMQLPNVKTVPIYKYNSGLLWKIMVLWIEKLELPYSSIWYGNWKKEIEKYDSVIIFDRNLNWNILRYIKRKKEKCKVIAWYWNLINSKNRVPVKYRKYCEEWTFDSEDARKYNIMLNTQFYFEQEYYEEDKKDDCFFVGADKNRIDDIERLYDLIDSLGYKSQFYVIKDKTSKNKKSRLYINKHISYEQVVEYIHKCECIVEINRGSQVGLTVRTLEAVFNNKKLITNNKCICKEPFYNRNNILIIDSNTTKETIGSFMKCEFVPYGDKIKEYDFGAWLGRF